MPQVAAASDALLTMIDGTVRETTDNTPLVLPLFGPVDLERVLLVKLTAVVFETQMTAGVAAEINASFFRRQGNLTLIAQSSPVILAPSTFGAPQPTLSLQANQSTQEIEAAITGKSGMAIRWHLEWTVKRTT